MEKQNLNPGLSIILFRFIFYLCAIYFLLMNLGLVFVPHLLLKNTAGDNVDPVILGMLRGAGGSMLPYSLLYYLMARKPFELKKAFYVIVVANVIAIIMDFTSVFLGEYELAYVWFDVPFEVLSLVGVLLFWTAKKDS